MVSLHDVCSAGPQWGIASNQAQAGQAPTLTLPLFPPFPPLSPSFPPPQKPCSGGMAGPRRLMQKMGVQAKKAIPGAGHSRAACCARPAGPSSAPPADGWPRPQTPAAGRTCAAQGSKCCCWLRVIRAMEKPHELQATERHDALRTTHDRRLHHRRSMHYSCSTGCITVAMQCAVQYITCAPSPPARTAWPPAAPPSPPGWPPAGRLPPGHAPAQRLCEIDRGSFERRVKLSRWGQVRWCEGTAQANHVR